MCVCVCVCVCVWCVWCVCVCVCVCACMLVRVRAGVREGWFACPVAALAACCGFDLCHKYILYFDGAAQLFKVDPAGQCVGYRGAAAGSKEGPPPPAHTHARVRA